MKYNVISRTQIQGHFENGLQSGYGRQFSEGEVVFEGQWLNGKLNGHAIQGYSNGTVVYDGMWKDGLKHGAGKLRYRDGIVHIGMWENGKLNGKGIQRYPNGEEYGKDAVRKVFKLLNIFFKLFSSYCLVSMSL